MKRVIFLKTEYLDLKGKKIGKEEHQKLIAKICDDSIKEFKKGIKELVADKTIKIIKDYAPEAQVLIQFEEDKRELVMAKLISLSIVDIIDSNILPGD